MELGVFTHVLMGHSILKVFCPQNILGDMMGFTEISLFLRDDMGEKFPMENKILCNVIKVKQLDNLLNTHICQIDKILYR